MLELKARHILDRRIGYLQVPQELASLTTLTRLNLSWNTGTREATVASGAHADETNLVPKMRVTEQSCRFLLHFPSNVEVLLMVTQEEKAALAGLITNLQRVRYGLSVLFMQLSQEFVVEISVW